MTPILVFWIGLVSGELGCSDRLSDAAAFASFRHDEFLKRWPILELWKNPRVVVVRAQSFGQSEEYLRKRS